VSVVELPLEAIHPNPHQPRREFPDEGLAELAASIREHGILQPLVVSPDGDGHYLLVAGERRWRAAKLAGLTTVPVVVKDLAPQQVLELSLVENLQRQDLNPLEEAEAFRRLRDEAGLSAEEIGRRIGKSGAYVRNRIRLLALPEEFQQRVSTGGISARQAEAILSALSVPPETRERVLQSPGWDSLTRAVQRGASSDELRYLADLAVGYATRRLENAEFPPDQPLAGEGIRASVCRECPMVVRGSLCGDPECFSRKEEAWYRQRLGVLSERLGVALLLPQERRQEVSRALEMMEELHPIVYRWDGGGFEEIQNLINIPAEDPNFRTALFRAPLPALRYALALVRGRDGHKARQETLEREIRKREQ